MTYQFIIVWSILAFSCALNNSLISLPFSLTSRLESNFYRNASLPFSFTNLTDTQNGWCPIVEAQQAEFYAARRASFISYASEFTALIGKNPELMFLAAGTNSAQFAHEGGIFVPETNEVWFTANQKPIQNTNVSSVNLKTNQVKLLSIRPPILTPNGVNYFDGSVYVCSQGNNTTAGGIYAVNPTTLVSRLVVNSWFGLHLNSPNDVVFTKKSGGRNYMWFTDPQFAYLQGFSSMPQLGSYVYRFDLTTSELRPVITDLISPNGVAFNHDETTMYVTSMSPGPSSTGAVVVYAYDLNENGLPINRWIFSVSTFGPDGIKVDKAGRVWTGEGDGINVRNKHGKLLGVILGYDLCETGVISNFALINSTVIILAQEKLWRLDLAEHVV